MQIFGQELIPPKLVQIMEQITSPLTAIFFVKKGGEFGKFYPEILSGSIHLNQIIEDAKKGIKEDKNTFSLRAIIWMMLISTALHEIRHGMQHKREEEINEEEAEEYQRTKTFSLAKTIDMEIPNHFGPYIEPLLLEIESSFDQQTTTGWEHIQTECLRHGALETDGKGGMVTSYKELARLSSDDPESSKWTPSQPENEESSFEENSFEENSFEETTSFKSSDEFQNNGIQDNGFQPKPYQENFNFYQENSISQPQPQDPPQDPTKHPLVEVLKRMHNHIFTKCGYNPEKGFLTPSQIIEPIYIGDIQTGIKAYKGTDSMGKNKDIPFTGTVNGTIDKGGPLYVLILHDGIARRIRPVNPRANSDQGREARLGIKRLVIFKGKSTKSCAVLEQAPGENIIFRQTNQ